MGGQAPKPSCCSVWIGPAGNVTPFHYDLCHGFLAGVIGTKVFTLVEPDDFRSMYPRSDQPELSRVDFDAARGDEREAEAEHALHPKFLGVTLRRVTVAPGDVLYTPPFWWHHVETVAEGGPAASVLVPFDPRDDEPMHVCHMR